MRTLKYLVLALSLALGACSKKAEEPLLINGAGATFPYPLYSKWFSEYQTVDPTVQINYQSIGSGGGIRQLLDKTVDFGASDAPMKNEELAKSEVPVLHIPTVLGAVVLSYHLPEIQELLQLSPDVIADIFLGKIKEWNDPRIQALNPSIKFPEKLPIIVVQRSDGSGTTAVFTDYLSKVSEEWRNKVGADKSVSWLTGVGGKGNEGVAGQIKQTPGAIGYLELVYAEQNKLPAAAVQNAAGAFVKASPASVSAAASAFADSMPVDFRISITNPLNNAAAYPISSFTYLLVYQKMASDKGKKLVDFLNWAMEKGQSFAEPLSYAPLPSSLVPTVKEKIASVQVQ